MSENPQSAALTVLQMLTAHFAPLNTELTRTEQRTHTLTVVDFPFAGKGDFSAAGIKDHFTTSIKAALW